MKNTVGAFIDMFDHSVHLWVGDDAECIDFFQRNNERWVMLPVNPSAENYCVLFRDCINEILKKSHFYSGCGEVICTGVRYHETATGYAESDAADPKEFSLKEIIFSPETLANTSTEMKEIIKKEDRG